jgi:hypothetical protein
VSPAEVIRPPRREREDWQYYQRADKKLTMPHRQGMACVSLGRRVRLSVCRLHLSNVRALACSFASIASGVGG